MSKLDWPTALGGLLPSTFQLPLETPNRGALLFDARGIVTSADTNILLLLGLDPSDILDKDSPAAVRAAISRCFKNAAAYVEGCDRIDRDPDTVFEDVLETAGGERRAIHRYSAPLFGLDGQQLGRVEVYSDITRRRALERAARRAYEELRSTQEQLVQSEKLRAVGEIASGVAHDFNNTLGIILGNIQLLLRSVEDEKALTRLQSAERAALDGVETIRRIREFTNMDASRQYSLCNLSSLSNEVAEMMKPVWQEAARASNCSIGLELDLSDGAAAFCNAAEIREVLINLILNAVQAMPDGGRLVISTGRSSEYVWFKVQDTGVGMSDDVRKRVFDPFFTTRGVEGSGLGLSVAYGIVRRHEGSISIDSEPGKGTAITVMLPAASGTCEAVTDDKTELQAVRHARILVVDDEEMFAEVLAEMLMECGHEVVAAHSGAEAVDIFREESFDLVFTDLGMPHMSGLQVAEAIKNIRPETPVALLTGWGASAVDTDDPQNTAVNVTLSKPVSFDQLSSVVADALRPLPDPPLKGEGAGVTPPQPSPSKGEGVGGTCLPNPPVPKGMG